MTNDVEHILIVLSFMHIFGDISVPLCYFIYANYQYNLHARILSYHHRPTTLKCMLQEGWDRTCLPLESYLVLDGQILVNLKEWMNESDFWLLFSLTLCETEQVAQFSGPSFPA